MKKLIALTAATAALALPAAAGTLTITYTEDGGTPTPVTYDSATNKATIDGTDITFDYTWDAEANKVCGKAIPDVGDLCLTFEGEAKQPEVGAKFGYKADNGTSGTAEITAYTE